VTATPAHELDTPDPDDRSRRDARRILAPDDVWVRCALDGRILEVSESVKRFGVTREEVLGTVASSWHADQAQGDLMRQQILAEGTLDDAEAELRTASGATFRVAVTAQLIVGRDGQPVACESFLRDTTWQHEIESRLRRAESLGALGQLARGTAHDFNNLLTVISGHAGMLLPASPPGTQASADLEAILECCTQGARLTHRLMQFGRTPVQSPTPVDLNETLRQTADLLGRTLRDQVRIELDLSEEPLPAPIHDLELQEIVTNLALNARDAMPGGGVLTIRTRRAPLRPGQDNAGAVIRVLDNGHGMNEHVRTRALEPFFTTKTGRGTGLGLALVDRAVRDHGGGVTIDSAPGSGTCIEIRLPLAP